jgi:hypothetical protein
MTHLVPVTVPTTPTTPAASGRESSSGREAGPSSPRATSRDIQPATTTPDGHSPLLTRGATRVHEGERLLVFVVHVAKRVALARAVSLSARTAVRRDRVVGTSLPGTSATRRRVECRVMPVRNAVDLVRFGEGRVRNATSGTSALHGVRGSAGGHTPGTERAGCWCWVPTSRPRCLGWEGG